MQKRTYAIGLGTLSMLLSGVAFADLTYDCSLVVNDTSKVTVQTTAPLSKEDVVSSLTDLKAYCCQQNIIAQGCEGAKNSTTNPESPYLFDQLVSRGFFKLDGILTAGSEDSKAQERKQTLEEWTKDGKGNIPLTIQNAFVQMREPTKRLQGRIDPKTCEITNYDSLDLAARYAAVCMQSACITNTYVLATNDLQQRTDLNTCLHNLTSMRINDEMTYIQTLMVRKTNALMGNMRTTYAQSYFVETRRNELLEKFARVNESLSAVNGKIQEGTRVCSK